MEVKYQSKSLQYQPYILCTTVPYKKQKGKIELMGNGKGSNGKLAGAQIV